MSIDQYELTATLMEEARQAAERLEECKTDELRIRANHVEYGWNVHQDDSTPSG